MGLITLTRDGDLKPVILVRVDSDLVPYLVGLKTCDEEVNAGMLARVVSGVGAGLRILGFGLTAEVKPWSPTRTAGVDGDVTTERFGLVTGTEMGLDG